MKVAEIKVVVNECINELEGLSFGDSRYTDLYNKAYKACSDYLDSHSCGGDWDIVYELYNDLDCLNDVKYREYAEADFLEYASHKDEPNFDWDYYSDWHKDLYGYRPR